MEIDKKQWTPDEAAGIIGLQFIGDETIETVADGLTSKGKILNAALDYLQIAARMSVKYKEALVAITEYPEDCGEAQSIAQEALKSDGD